MAVLAVPIKWKSLNNNYENRLKEIYDYLDTFDFLPLLLKSQNETITSYDLFDDMIELCGENIYTDYISSDEFMDYLRSRYKCTFVEEIKYILRPYYKK